MKGITIISNRHTIYELPKELPNDLRLKILGNEEVSAKSQNFIDLWPSAQRCSRNDNFVNTN